MKTKSKKIQIFNIIFTFILTLNTILPSFVFAESTTKDSFGSINIEDNTKENVGIDETQDQKTLYSEEIENEGIQGANVYVSQASTFGVFIPKTIILDGKKNENGINKANYVVKVANTTNINGNEIINVLPDEEFKLSQLGKNDILASISQDKQQWKHNEIDVIGNGEISTSGMTAGNWKGQFNFNIELNLQKIPIVAFDENGINLNATASYILGNQKIDLINKLIEKGYIETAKDVSLLINVQTDDFENISITTFNISNIAKPGDIVAIYHFNEITQEWEYIGTKTVEENGCVTEIFYSFSPVAFIVESKEEHIHNYKTTIEVEPTCTTKGSTKYTCECGDNYTLENIDALGHNYTSKVTNPTCEEKGYTTHTCTRCNNSYVDSEVNVLGHKYENVGSESIHTKCNVCNKTTTTHAYNENVVLQPTCETKGKTKYTCGCGYNYTLENIDALGHDFATSYTIDKAATCTTKGSKSQHCSRCSATQNVTEIPATGHSYGNVSYSWNGYTACTGSRTCATCNNVENVSATITNAITKAATCETTGIKTYTATFSNNAYTTQTKEETLAKLGHNYIEQTRQNATCVEQGILITKCSHCENIIETILPIDVTNHNYSMLFTIDEEATCTKEGSKSQHCLNNGCDSKINIQTIPTIEHNYQNVGIENIHTQCSVCNNIINSHTLTPSIVLQPTCNTKGKTKYTCECGYSYTLENIENTNHTIVGGECINCDYTIAGLYDENGILLCTWEESGIDATKNYMLSSSWDKDPTSGYCVITNKYPTTTKLILPNNITTLGAYSFCGCSTLEEIIIPNTITTLYQAVFHRCTGITNIKIPNSVTYMAGYVFQSCSNLKSINLPKEMTYMGEYMFHLCPNLETINYTGTQAQWNTMTKGSYWNLGCNPQVVYNYQN